MKDKTSFYNVIMYTLLVFALSGLLMLLHFIFDTAGNYWIVFPQFAPILTLIVLLLIRGHEEITFDIKQCFSINKRISIYCLLVTLFVFIVFGGFGFVLTNYDKTFSQWEIPFLQWETPSLVIGFICLLAGCIGEEIGWRAFLLPMLNRNLSLIISSLFVGILWGAWHLDFGDGIIGFFVTILFITSLSIIISWVQIRSGGKSIIPAIIFHFFVNFFARSTLFDMSLLAHFILSMLLGFICFILFLTDRKTFMSKRNQSNVAN